MLIILVLTLGAYLLGSVCTAIIVCRLMGLPDPRTEGSGNPGATNVLRLGGKKAAAITLGGDFLKGWLPVATGSVMGLNASALAAVGLAAFLGHLYPVFFRFQGGKGVATAGGVLLGFTWPVAAAAALTWLIMAKVFRISSLSALMAAALSPVYMSFMTSEPALVAATAVMSGMLLWRHRGNIQRLLAGEEGKIGR